MVLEWENPPPDARRTRVNQVVAQLMAKPGEWAKIDEGPSVILPWWQPLANDPRFEMKYVSTSDQFTFFGPRKVYCRFKA